MFLSLSYGLTQEIAGDQTQAMRDLSGWTLVASVVEENTAATEQMSASSGQVSKSIEGVAGIAEENSAATQEVSASAQEMSAQVEEVVASAQSLAQMSEDLQKAVSTFKLDGDGAGAEVKASRN